MQLSLTPSFATVLLVASTVTMALVAGAAFAYLSWGNDTGNRGLKHWMVWLVSMITLFGWAWLVGSALRTPGVQDSYALATSALAVALFFAAYVPLGRALRRSAVG